MQPQQPPAPTQQKEINTVMVCKIGLEAVQEIVNRTHEIFNYLKSLQPPFGSQNLDKVYIEKQHRLHEVLGGITQHFKRLRLCWEKANVSPRMICSFNSYDFFDFRNTRAEWNTLN